MVTDAAQGVGLSDPIVPITGSALVLVLAAALATLAHVLHERRGGFDSLDRDGLEANGLSRSFRGRTVVDDVTLSVRPGTVLGIIGPNGAGKTTLLRMLVGLIRPDAGHVSLFGEPVESGSPILRRVGCSLEEAGFLPGLSGRRNLDLWWQATGRDPAASFMETVCDWTRLGDALDRRAGEYSQGMRRRLSIATAMLGLPDLLVLDEPTNGLDPEELAHFRAMIGDYARSGRAVVISSHLLVEVAAMSTDIAVIVGGKLSHQCAVSELGNSPGYEVRLERAAEVASALKMGRQPFRVAVTGPQTLIALGGGLSSDQLAGALRELSVDVASLRPLSPVEALYFGATNDHRGMKQ